MRPLRGASLLLTALVSAGCVDSSLLLTVRADGSGHATLTTRLYLSGMQALDTLSAADATAPRRPPQLQEELPAPSQGMLAETFGIPVTLVSSTLEAAVDGGIRRTEVEFDDIRKVQLSFPPLALFPAFGAFSSTAIETRPLITFTMHPHEDGDAILLVRLPDPKMTNDPQADITTFQTDSPEERAIKQAIKHMALRLSIETEQTLLRTNAPRREGNRATVFDLNLDKMINAMDESVARRMVAPGSFQELLWQLGDLPGAVVPVDHEVFLEYQPPDPQQRPAPPAAPAAAPAPPDTDIYLAPLKTEDGRITVGAPANITNNPGYDNQPSFTPDGRSVLFTSQRGPSPGLRDAAATAQTDVYRYDIGARSIARVTQTPESEYSPTVMLDGERLSVVRVEADGTQRLAAIAPSGPKIQIDVILPGVTPVGYHAWADDHTLALFVLGANGAPATLQLADTRSGQARVIATDIGRSIQRMPGSGPARHISFVQRQREGDRTTLVIEELDPATGAVTPLTRAVEGSREADVAWTPDGTLLMANDDVLYAWSRGQSGWKAVTSLSQLSLHGVTRLAVSPKGDWLALVGQSARRD
jgi:hypothetical protein